MAAHAVSGVICAFGVLTFIAIALVNLLVVPRFIKTFEDFDTDMPQITVWMIQARVPAMIMAFALAAVLVMKEILIPNPQIKGLINLCIGLLAVLGAAMLVFGLYLPMAALMHAAMGGV